MRQQALDIALHFRPEAALLDVMMPDRLDRYVACAEPKGDPAFGRPTSSILTEGGQQADFDEGAAIGADAYLSKLFSPDVVRTTMNLLLGERRAA